MFLRLGSCVALVAAVLAASFARADQATGTRVTSARVMGDTVEFESPIELPWDSLARAALPTLDFARPEVALLERYFYEPGGASELPFGAALIPAAPRVHFMALTMAGPVPLTPVGLSGRVEFDTRPPDWLVETPGTAFGYLRAVAPDLAAPVRFVLWSPDAPGFTTREASVTLSADTAVVRSAGANGTDIWRLGPVEFVSPENPATAQALVYTASGGTSTLVLLSVDFGAMATPCVWYGAVYDVTTEPRLLTFTGECDA